ncbi:MAG: pirin family protein [Bdellovibrionales bacterium]|nr:pirin family protein [Bdellovibrionales bacterium]
MLEDEKKQLILRKSADRGFADHGWLQSHHTFSFADYYDEKFMGFGVLRVINEDIIKGGAGFATHGHKDMEILTYVVEGALEHKDSMGNQSIIYPGEVQRMSAGMGVRHSEFNHLKNSRTHLLQIWIVPDKMNLAPGYEQKSFLPELKKNQPILVASKEGKNNSVRIHQEVEIYVLKATSSGKIQFQLSQFENYWLQVICGDILIDNNKLLTGDAIGLRQTKSCTLQWSQGAHLLLFALP